MTKGALVLLGIFLTAISTTQAQAAQVTVTARSGLNCRAQSNSSSAIYGLLGLGEQVEVTGRQGNWLTVRCPNGRPGFIYVKYVRLSGPQTVRTAEPPASPDASASESRRSDARPAISCGAGRARRTSKVTHYFGATLPRFNERVCKLEGTCFYRQNGVEMIYNYGVGHQPVSRARCPYGWGSRGNCLNPCKSVAADLRYHKVGDRLFFPSLRGKICRGKVHDGYVTVADKGDDIKGPDRFDFFWGNCSNPKSGDICGDGNSQWGFPTQIEKAMSNTSYCVLGQGKSEETARLLMTEDDSSSAAR